MAMPSSGPISFANLNTVYGNGGIVPINEYYRKTDNSGLVDHSKVVTLSNYYSETAPTYYWYYPSSGSGEVYWNGVKVNGSIGIYSGTLTFTAGGYTYDRGNYVKTTTYIYTFYYYRVSRTGPVYLNQNVPTAGQISMSQFYGGTN